MDSNAKVNIQINRLKDKIEQIGNKKLVQVCISLHRYEYLRIGELKGRMVAGLVGRLQGRLVGRLVGW